MTLLAWLGAGLIGLSLGLLGSGGSTLTVPILVYLLGQSEKVAITNSLAIVGGIALAGGLNAAWKKGVDWRSVLLFGLPGMAGTYAGAWLARFVSGALQLAVFAGVMLLAAFFMIRPPRLRSAPSPTRRSPLLVSLDGVLVGTLTGFVGIGGGFLIVPALVLLGGLPIHLAMGTSLMIIALNSFTGFYKYLNVLDSLHLAVDWPVIGLFIVIGSVGTFVGRSLAGRLPQHWLRRIFAVFLFAIGLFILGHNLPKVL